MLEWRVAGVLPRRFIRSIKIEKKNFLCSRSNDRISLGRNKKRAQRKKSRIRTAAQRIFGIRETRKNKTKTRLVRFLASFLQFLLNPCAKRSKLSRQCRRHEIPASCH